MRAWSSASPLGQTLASHLWKNHITSIDRPQIPSNEGICNVQEDQINVENQVKEIGLHTVKVVLGPDTSFDITLEIVPDTK